MGAGVIALVYRRNEQRGFQNVSMTSTMSGEPRASCGAPLVGRRGRYYSRVVVLVPAEL